jgi:CheY-like chemotaxis protein
MMRYRKEYSMNPATILVVEDERIVAKDLQLRLCRLGFAVPDTASSGEEAIRKAGSLRPQLVLMDIHLEGSLDGLEAARRIREEFKSPGHFLSAFGDEGTLRKAQLLHPVGYLGKPVEDQQLYAAVNTFFSRTTKPGK